MEATFITQLIIAIGLSIFSLVFFLMKRLYPQKHFPELVPRLKTWWGMFIIFSIAVFFDPIVSLISLAVLCFFSLKEFFSMMKTRKIDRQLFLWVYLSIPIQFYWIYTDWYGMFIIFIPIYVFLFMPLPRIFSKSTVRFLSSLGSIQWGLMLMVFGLSHLAYYQVASPEYGANLVLFLVLLTQVSDLSSIPRFQDIRKKKSHSYIKSVHHVGRIIFLCYHNNNYCLFSLSFFNTFNVNIRTYIRCLNKRNRLLW